MCLTDPNYYKDLKRRLFCIRFNIEKNRNCFGGVQPIASNDQMEPIPNISYVEKMQLNNNALQITRVNAKRIKKIKDKASNNV